MNFSDFVQNIRSYLSNNKFTQSNDPQASVLIPFFEKNGEPWVLLTKRAGNLTKHSGQVSFPGGKVDPEDTTPEETAFRETSEEIGIRKPGIELFGRWNDFWTPYFKRVATYVGQIHSFETLTPEPQEIEKIILTPLSTFSDKKNHWVENRIHEGVTYHVHYFNVDGEIVWGATGGVLFYLLRDLGIISYGYEYSPVRSGLN